jgi:DNA-binding protein HU-beta
VNKAELVDAIVAESGATKSTVTEVLKGFEDVVVKNVSKGEKIVLSGFLSFERVARKARTARNPQTGEAIQVKASNAPLRRPLKACSSRGRRGTPGVGPRG